MHGTLLGSVRAVRETELNGQGSLSTLTLLLHSHSSIATNNKPDIVSCSLLSLFLFLFFSLSFASDHHIRTSTLSLSRSPSLCSDRLSHPLSLSLSPPHLLCLLPHHPNNMQAIKCVVVGGKPNADDHIPPRLLSLQPTSTRGGRTRDM
jgi:hypothetical protein